MPEEWDPDPPSSWEPEASVDPRPRPGRANWIVAGLIAAFGAVTFIATVRAGRVDSALLFVGLPVLLAATLAVMPARTSHGRVFVCTTIGLLLVAVLLNEGPICVILAAPLVYLLAHGVTLLVQLIVDRQRGYAWIAVPLVLVAALEGTGDSLRVQPEQSVAVVRVVALPAEEVAARITAGPRPVRLGSMPLRALGVPMPVHVDGQGVAPGDRWRFGYHGSSHGPGGAIVTEVTATENRATEGTVEFAVVEDTAITARWFSWQDAEISWRAVDDGHAEVRVSATFNRGLDPSWYFGPLQDFLMHQGLAHLLDMLQLPEPG